MKYNFFKQSDEDKQSDESLILVLERIADALEIIADSKEQNGVNLNKSPVIPDIEKSILENKVANDFTNKSTILKEDDHKLSNPIEEFLLSKNIHIKYVPEENVELNKVLYSLASYMGNNYSKIKNVYKAIKSKLSDGGTTKVFMSNYPQEHISASCQFCLRLKDLAFLDTYKYLKSPKYQLIASPNRIPLAINFLTGHWLECYITNEVKQILNSYHVNEDVSFILNPQITLPNGDDFELDVLFSIGEEIYWIEAKTSGYQHYIDKYSKISKLMNDDHLHPIMVLSDVPQSTCNNLSYLFDMEVLNVECFTNRMLDELEQYKRTLGNINLYSGEYYELINEVL